MAPSPENAKFMVSQTGLPVLLLYYLLLTYIAHRGRDLTERIACVLYIVAGMSWIVRVYAADALLDLLRLHSTMSCAHMIMAAMFCNTRATFAIEAACWFAHMIKAQTLQGNPETMILYFAVRVPVNVAVAYITMLMIEKEVRASLASENDAAAFQSMLSTLCDSVVKLNQDLQIEGPAPKLAHMMSSLANLQGRNFLDLFISKMEQKRFTDHIGTSCSAYWARTSSTGSLASTTAHHASLFNGESEVPVRIFHASLTDAESQLSHHLLGICHAPHDGMVTTEVLLDRRNRAADPMRAVDALTVRMPAVALRESMRSDCALASNAVALDNFVRRTRGRRLAKSRSSCSSGSSRWRRTAKERSDMLLDDVAPGLLDASDDAWDSFFDSITASPSVQK